MAARNSLKSGGWTAPRATRDDEEKRAERKPAAGLVAVKSSPKSEPAEKPAEKPASGTKNSIRAGGGASAANSAYVANLRKQAADRAATEQRNYMQVTGNRPGLPNTGGGEEKQDPSKPIMNSAKSPTGDFWDPKREREKQEPRLSNSAKSWTADFWAPDRPRSGDKPKGSLRTSSREEVGATREANFTPVFREMTWDDYNALDGETRSAVDANSLLQQAVSADKALLETLDLNQDGRVSYAEGRADYGAGDDANYAGNYNRVFDRTPSILKEEKPRNQLSGRAGMYAGDGVGRNDDLTYAPNTLAALNLLDIDDSKGRLDDYLSGAAFMTTDDIEAGLHKRKDGSGLPDPANIQGRDALGVRTTEGMSKLSQQFDSGNTMVDGQLKATSVSGAGADRLGQLVASLRQGMAEGKSFDALTRFSDTMPTRVDLSALDDPEYAERRGYLDLLYSNIESQEGPEALLNKEKILPFLEEEGSSWGEWQRLVTDRKRYGKTRDYESTATYLGDARSQVMAQVEQIIAQGGSVTDEEVDAWINGLSQEMLNQNRKGK